MERDKTNIKYRMIMAWGTLLLALSAKIEKWVIVYQFYRLFESGYSKTRMTFIQDLFAVMVVSYFTARAYIDRT